MQLRLHDTLCKLQITGTELASQAACFSVEQCWFKPIFVQESNCGSLYTVHCITLAHSSVQAAAFALTADSFERCTATPSYAREIPHSSEKLSSTQNVRS